MDRRLFSIILLCTSSLVLGQVGIGTRDPHQSALLDIEANVDDLKGVLIPRVSLLSNTDNSKFNQGITANSLLVFNTTKNNLLSPGFYYWFENRWIRILTNDKEESINFPVNEELAVNIQEKKLFLRDSNNAVVSVPLSDVNILTTLKYIKSGVYVYESEDGTNTTIDIPSNVIENITTILEDNSVVNEILKVVQNSGKALTGDSIIQVVGGNKAVLETVGLQVNNYSITNDKLIATADDKGKVLMVSNEGKLQYVFVSDTNTEIKSFNIDDTGNFLQLVDSNNHTFPVLIQDLNIITSLNNQKNGSYIYLNELGESSIINVVNDVINNIETILSNQHVTEEIYKSVASKGKNLSSSDQSLIIVGGDKSTLQNTLIDIATGGVTNSKIADEAVTTDKIKGDGENKILGTNASGQVEWIEISDSTIGEIVRNKETVTILQDNGDGTFTYYNEKKVNEDGKVIPGVKGTLFNANTLSIDSSKPGVYVFKDKGSSTPLAVINTKANTILFEDNSSIEYTTVEEAITNIINRVEQLEGKKGKLTGTGILINGEQNVDEAVLKDLILSIENNAITTEKVSAGAITTEKISSFTKQIKEESNKVLLSDGNGAVYYKSVDVIFDEKGSPLGLEGPIEVVQGINEKVVLQPITIAVKKQGISEEYIADRAVTQDKLVAPGSALLGDVPALQLDSSIKYQPVSELVKRDAGVLSSTDKSILINKSFSEAKSILSDVDLSLNNDAVITDKIKDFAVTENKLWAGENKEKFVAVAQSDGSVLYQGLPDVLEGQIFSVDNSLEVIGDASKAILAPLELRVKNGGIITNHIEDNAVTAVKIGSKNASRGSVLSADGSGNTVFESIDTVVYPMVQGDIIGDSSITILEGKNTIFGDSTKQVVFSISRGGVNGAHIAYQTIQNKHIANKTIESTKLNAGSGNSNRLAIADDEGNVSFQVLEADKLTNTGSVTTDGIVIINDGNNKVLSDFKLGIADQSITTDKLNADGALVGSVATVDVNGGVSYQAIKGSSISDASALKTDGIIKVNNENIANSTLLQEAMLSIANKGITTNKIADEAIETLQISDLAVTSSKISSEGAGGAKRVLISGINNEAKWAELDQIVENTSGDLTTDQIIKITNQSNNGIGALLKDVALSINDSSISKKKLSSVDDDDPRTNIAKDRVLLTDGNGGFDYVTLDAVQVDGEDLKLGSALEFTSGSGIKAMLMKTDIDVKEGGITNSKLGNGAVTINKISSKGEAENTVLTADGQGNVTYKAINEGVFAGKQANLLSDGSIEVANDNNALLKETSIAIAKSGVKNKHIENLSVNVDKISSEVEGINVSEGNVLSADGLGNVFYNSLSNIANTQGKDLSSDGSLTIKSGNKAVLKAVNMSVSKEGILNKHIGIKQVTSDKIGSGELSKDYLLVSDGEGGTSFETLEKVVENIGQSLNVGDALFVENGEYALLRDATISLRDLGVTNAKLANKNITAIKMNTGNSLAGNVLTSLGDGEAQYLPMSQYGSALSSDTSIKVNSGMQALLKPVHIEVNELGILTKHLGNKQVTLNKMSSYVNGLNTAADKVLMADGNGGMTFGSVNLGVGSLNESTTIDVINGDNAVLKDMSLNIRENSISTFHIKNKSITAPKLASEVGQLNYVGVTDGNGGVIYKDITSLITENAGNLMTNGAIEINVGSGINALNHNVSIQLKEKGVTTDLIADKAITTEQMASDAITTIKVSDKAITQEKISSKTGDANALDGTVLTADGKGGATYKTIENSIVNYSFTPQETGQKWLNTSLKIVMQVFDITLNSATNKVVIPSLAMSNEIISARFIKKGENSISYGLLKKEVQNGNTILYLGTPGFITTYHSVGNYYLILEYIKQ